MYDIVKLKKIHIKERRSYQQRYSQKGKVLKNVAPSDNSIFQNSENSNSKFLSDIRDNDKDTFQNADTTNIALKERGQYPRYKQIQIQEYIDSVDPKIKKDYESVVAGDKTFKRNYISQVNSRQAQDFKKLTGVDVEGYTNNINTSAYEHIYRRHGSDGEHDTTMAKSEDVARMKYVIENYDDAKLVVNEDTGEPEYSSWFRDKNDKPAKMVSLSKKVDGVHYVVVTAADNNYKKLWVVTTYIKKRVTQALDVQAPRSDVRNALASPLEDNISRNSENDNSKFSKTEKNSGDGKFSDGDENEGRMFSMRNIAEEDYGVLLEERDDLKNQVNLLRKQFEVTKGHAPKMSDVELSN